MAQVPRLTAEFCFRDGSAQVQQAYVHSVALHMLYRGLELIVSRGAVAAVSIQFAHFLIKFKVVKLNVYTCLMVTRRDATRLWLNASCIILTISNKLNLNLAPLCVRTFRMPLPSPAVSPRRLCALLFSSVHRLAL